MISFRHIFSIGVLLAMTIPCAHGMDAIKFVQAMIHAQSVNNGSNSSVAAKNKMVEIDSEIKKLKGRDVCAQDTIIIGKVVELALICVDENKAISKRGGIFILYELMNDGFLKVDDPVVDKMLSKLFAEDCCLRTILYQFIKDGLFEKDAKVLFKKPDIEHIETVVVYSLNLMLNNPYNGPKYKKIKIRAQDVFALLIQRHLLMNRSKEQIDEQNEIVNRRNHKLIAGTIRQALSELEQSVRSRKNYDLARRVVMALNGDAELKEQVFMLLKALFMI